MPSQLNRRKFVEATAVCGTAILGSRSAVGQASGARKRSPNDQIGTAILGIRGQGRSHIRYLASQENVRIVTLCDPDERLFAKRVKMVDGPAPKTEVDLRRVLDDKDVDCVTIAMPNHWHALATIWACQAGKDVYVEKPATWCIAEGRKMTEAAGKHDRIVQTGTHLRARQGRRAAIRLLRDGVIGELYMARAYIFNPRRRIGHQVDGPVPQGVHYDLWRGPAPLRPFNTNRFHYNWHWFWECGNGETGNNGPHLTDLVIDGLNKQDELPVSVASQGGRYVWNDQGETPNVQVTTYTYADGTLVSLDVRNLAANKEAGTHEGVIFFGANGFMTVSLDGSFHTVVDGKKGPQGSGGGAHAELFKNFFDAVRSRNKQELWAPIEYGVTGAGLCHLANIAYRVGRSVTFDPQTETFPDDEEANALVTRSYRKPFAV